MQTASVAAFHQPCFSDTFCNPVRNVVLTGSGSHHAPRFGYYKPLQPQEKVCKTEQSHGARNPPFPGPSSLRVLFASLSTSQVATQTAGAFNSQSTRISRNLSSMLNDSNALTLSSTPSATSVSRSAFQLACCVMCCELDVRRHVNKMCIAGGIPLFESGTAGYLGQVQPLLKVCLSLRYPRCYPPWYRTIQRVLVVYQSRPQGHFLCAPSDQPFATYSLYCLARSYLLPYVHVFQRG